MAKLQWDAIEKAHILFHGWTVCEDDGLLVIPSSEWAVLESKHPGFYGHSIWTPSQRVMVIPSVGGTCLLMEGKHFLVAQHPAWPHMSYGQMEDVHRRVHDRVGMTRRALVSFVDCHEHYWNQQNFSMCDELGYELEQENYHDLLSLLRQHMYVEARRLASCGEVNVII